MFEAGKANVASRHGPLSTTFGRAAKVSEVTYVPFLGQRMR